MASSLSVGLLCVLLIVVAAWLFVAGRKGVKKLRRKGYYLLAENVVPAEVVPHDSGRLRFMVVGDVGTGDADQARVAATMHRLHKERPYDFALMLGDTFYERGLSSPEDPLFDRLFESQYGDLGIPCFAIAGNHDAKQNVLPLVLNSKRSRTWRMPNFSYRLETPVARLHLLNTNLNLLELMRLRGELKPDASRWTFVVGHHSLYANGTQGDWDLAGRAYWHAALRSRADFYLGGHNHQLEHLRIPGQATDYVVSGSGGSHYRAQVAAIAGGAPPRWKRSHASSLFLYRDNGLVDFDVTAERVLVRYLDARGEVLYEFERTR